MNNDPAAIHRASDGTTGSGVRRVRRLRLAVLLPVIGLALLAACGGGDGRSPTPPTSPTTAAGASTTAPRASVPPRSESTTRPPVSEPGASALANGTHPVYLAGVDTGRRTIAVDLVQLLDRTSAEAKDVCPEVAAGDVDGYCIKNVNSQLRTVGVPSSASISVLNGSASRKVDLAGLAKARRPQKEDSFFEVTVSGGKVTTVKELYRP